ncbi:MAG TPA: ArsR family transcriptional regulator [Methanomassiliicoccaceae archaeon]|jgi:predicted transcriptional regulator|nr:ArsR family transcriptional regulator [Methanomassiliicoccaceae archaeon]
MLKEPQIAKLLTANGLAPNVARVLACWTEDDDELTQVDIEMFTRLRQPEVSVAVRELRRRGWIATSLRPKEGKGRPLNVYRLAMPMREIVREIVRERTREIDRQQELAAQLLQAVA